jgi:hypothetical protein
MVQLDYTEDLSTSRQRSFQMVQLEYTEDLLISIEGFQMVQLDYTEFLLSSRSGGLLECVVGLRRGLVFL